MSRMVARAQAKLLVAFIFVLLVAPQSFATEFKDFIISYWCGPPAGQNYDAQYAEVAECNFTHAMYPVNGGKPEQKKTIFNAYEKQGLKYITYDRRLFAHVPGETLIRPHIDAINDD